MKYIKTFENYYNTEYDSDNFKKFLIKFLERVKNNNFTVATSFSERDEEESAIALKTVDIRKNYSFREDKPILTIRVLQVNDKKLRDKLKTKFKIYIKTCYDTTGIADQEFVDVLIEFLDIIFKKYSYWSKKNWCYNYNKINYEYYINTSNINNIIKNLDDVDLELYKNIRKFNL